MNKINRMYILSFLFTLHIALSAYVNSTFLTKIISEKYVGILYTISSLVTLIFLSRSVNILKYFGNRKFVLSSLLVNSTIHFSLFIFHFSLPYTFRKIFFLYRKYRNSHSSTSAPRTMIQPPSEVSRKPTKKVAASRKSKIAQVR